MAQYIDKSALVAWAKETYLCENASMIRKVCFKQLLEYLDSLEVIDPYEQYIQYTSIESGIKAHAEDYSFNIESELFNQLTKEQQALWRKEIEQACISGGYAGYQLAKDPRYKKNLEVKEVDLDLEIKKAQRKYKTIEEYEGYPCTMYANNIECIAKHFFELGLKAQKGEEV